MEYMTHWLLGLIVFLEIKSYLERKALYTRLMARDLNELKSFQAKPKPKEPLRVEI